MRGIFSKVYSRIKAKYFPSIILKEIKRWYRDGGDCRLRFNYELKPDSIVFDIGGFEGDFASDLYARMPCKIFSFEPIKQFADEMIDRFRLNPDISIFHYGLSSSDQSVDISIDGSNSSVHRKSIGSTERIMLRDITKVIHELNVGRIDLMKINIEGGEYEVLPKIIEAKLLSRINNLQIQFHEIDSESFERMNRIRKMLELTHDCIYCYDFVWEDWRIKNPL